MWDFNLPEIDWEILIPSPGCGHPTFYRDCLEVLNGCLLEQMVTSPTRGQNVLDLFLTTNPTLVDNVSIIQGLSDHDIVLIQVNVKPEVLKQVPRNIHLYKKADWDQLKHCMRDVYVELKQSDLATSTVQSMWDRFATGLEQGIYKGLGSIRAIFSLIFKTTHFVSVYSIELVICKNDDFLFIL